MSAAAWRNATWRLRYPPRIPIRFPSGLKADWSRKSALQAETEFTCGQLRDKITSARISTVREDESQFADAAAANGVPATGWDSASGPGLRHHQLSRLPAAGSPAWPGASPGPPAHFELGMPWRSERMVAGHRASAACAIQFGPRVIAPQVYRLSLVPARKSSALYDRQATSHLCIDWNAAWQACAGWAVTSDWGSSNSVPM